MTESATFLVDSMSCEGCVSSVKRAISAIEGVQHTDISLETKAVTIAFDPSLTAPDSLRKAIEGAGYDVD